MNPLDGILRAAGTMSYYGRRQETTANNLANVNTAGFKMDRLTARGASDLTHPVPVHTVDLSQGSLRPTGRQLDVALEGAGFLVLDTARGERLSRGGSLRLDGDGRLVGPEGDAVLGEGGHIVVRGATIAIDPDGTVRSDGEIAGKLRLVGVGDDARLVKEGSGQFLVENGQPTDPDGVVIRQGQLEEPNIDTIRGMISLVEIQRAYGSAVTALRTMDGVLGTVTAEVAKL